MYHQISVKTESLRFYTEVRSQSKIPYITTGQMKKRYPDEGFVIIGEIGSLARAPTDGDRLYLEDGKTIPIYPRGSLKRPFEWVAGYAAVDESSYVAVIGGFFQLFMKIGCIVKVRRQ